ncbi:Nucleoside-diphosphate-sugar epimerase [Micromonospora rhizosphaerae]|uniref:Nucleoside-diphosphate-sugar epimerase n=1 Tax=Micromonospora rhizosphaerae TaxID=568872 RepID=A0A1C6RLT6_9ACTN|nr:Nucleoside-diphosphate-sugar epimerase [Micromonospora rhizosphaerae]
MDRGHEVTASTHRSENFSVIDALGARPALMDRLDEAAVRQAVLEAEPEVIINEITALSAPSRDYGKWLEVTNRLRSEGTKTLMMAAREAGTRRVVAQSASFMTQPVGSGLTDESTPLYLDAPEPIRSHIQANIAAETLVLGTPGIEGVVLRYGFLYGEGTAIGPGGEWATGVKSGDVPIVGEGAGRYPFVHVRDAVSATVQAVDRGSPGIYNVVGDEPAPQAEWLPYLAETLDAPPPRRVSEEEAEEQIGVQAVYYGTQLRGQQRQGQVRAGAEPRVPVVAGGVPRAVQLIAPWGWAGSPGRGRRGERKAGAGVNEPATSGSVAAGQLHMPMTGERVPQPPQQWRDLATGYAKRHSSTDPASRSSLVLVVHQRGRSARPMPA